MRITSDDRIIDLLEDMNETYAFIHDTEAYRKLDLYKIIYRVLAAQTTECSYFLRKYFQKGFRKPLYFSSSANAKW